MNIGGVLRFNIGGEGWYLVELSDLVGGGDIIFCIVLYFHNESDQYLQFQPKKVRGPPTGWGGHAGPAASPRATRAPRSPPPAVVMPSSRSRWRRAACKKALREKRAAGDFVEALGEQPHLASNRRVLSLER